MPSTSGSLYISLNAAATLSGVAAPATPQTTPNPFSTALSNALGIGNLFANIYGAVRGN